MFQDSQDSSCSSDIVGARIEFESSEIAGGLAFNRVFLSSGDFGVELARPVVMRTAIKTKSCTAASKQPAPQVVNNP
jgi:hypothetical protein